jgi:predicted cupin superfamily sugar epimerase
MNDNLPSSGETKHSSREKKKIGCTAAATTTTMYYVYLLNNVTIGHWHEKRFGICFDEIRQLVASLLRQ